MSKPGGSARKPAAAFIIIRTCEGTIMFKTISFHSDRRIGVLTIARPESLNALNSAVLTELHELFQNLKRQKLGALVVTGAGEKSFVAGADIKEMESMTP